MQSKILNYIDYALLLYELPETIPEEIILVGDKDVPTAIDNIQIPV